MTATSLPSLNVIKIQILKVLAPSKIKIFLWKAVSGTTRGIKMDMRCQVCGLQGESINHILFTCTIARQIWALSGLPSPVGGFSLNSIYANMYDALLMGKNSKIDISIRRSFPCILWLLWKNRNNLIFEGRLFLVTDLVLKIRESSHEWFQAQELSQEEEEINNLQSPPKDSKSWRPPSKPWLKCNVATSWNQEKSLCGASWVLRNYEGRVLMHARTAICDVDTKDTAQLQGSLWAIESMRSLKIPRVMFAQDTKELVGATNRPDAWPNFRYHSECLLRALASLPHWRTVLEDRKTNLGAFLIARSVTREDRLQSYIALGYPFWLQKLFENEKCITPV
ncbi:PREDICTED: uncharacterized protein LOC104704647 [Camelina sativa]|uniref:Uncharacterized protein LOC104704647 n=1 Tax=Camelina sativa TaxID=90675 RepID=A0ABM0T0M6_CAMSA|nr:PREDICTED: uncharacterized protein LOC104704647 [Camelina sativa]